MHEIRWSAIPGRHPGALRPVLASELATVGVEVRARDVAVAAGVDDAEVVEILLWLQALGACKVTREWEAEDAKGEPVVIAVRRYSSGPPPLKWYDELGRELEEGDLTYAVLAEFDHPVQFRD